MSLSQTTVIKHLKKAHDSIDKIFEYLSYNYPTALLVSIVVSAIFAILSLTFSKLIIFAALAYFILPYWDVMHIMIEKYQEKGKFFEFCAGKEEKEKVIKSIRPSIIKKIVLLGWRIVPQIAKELTDQSKSYFLVGGRSLNLIKNFGRELYKLWNS